ncbi:Asp-tRNA(Asn)/Glu-tRNA(Gln) amidotransferase subunit GatC [Candidatus Parcubacteria bacterium]|jgi:aspartyl-tRNA(Asn)/glutamyl-tRNA(Gln) amidotransferase subunit C|nr:MAG: Asp-tRNA(Asn)/Glu-tRNA(Gln) amidotransferase subunit GatC [Candidatus Parcubacteria bacterium]
MVHISKAEVEHLAELSRIELDDKEKTSLQNDLENILSYFDELKALNTDAILPKTGGALTMNELRVDSTDTRVPGDVVQSFPEREGNLLKVPKVFEK